MALSSPPLYADAFVPADFRAGRAIRLPKMVLGPDWIRWLSDDLVLAVDRTSRREVHVTLTAQGGSIAATSFAIGTVHPGMYRISYYTRITRAATTSSELTITFGWTDGAGARTISGALINGNTVNTLQVGTVPIRVDAATALTYSTTYASVGGTSMLYRLDMVAQLVGSEEV